MSGPGKMPYPHVGHAWVDLRDAIEMSPEELIVVAQRNNLQRRFFGKGRVAADHGEFLPLIDQAAVTIHREYPRIDRGVCETQEFFQVR